MNDLAALVVVDLLKENLIPNDAFFEIQEHHLESYIKLYGLYKSKELAVNTKSTANYRYARKLAGLTLVKLKLEKGAKANQVKEGFVYTVYNSAWPDHLKLGMSVDVKKRIANYQTYSPFRDYKMQNYEFVFDRRETERLVKEKFSISIESGEWLKNIQASHVMDFVRDYSPGALLAGA